MNIAVETLTDYRFLSRYHHTKSKNYLNKQYRIRHWIPMFSGTPCIIIFTCRNGYTNSLMTENDYRGKLNIVQA